VHPAVSSTRPSNGINQPTTALATHLTSAATLAARPEVFPFWGSDVGESG